MNNLFLKSAVRSCKKANIRLNNLETLLSSVNTQSIPTHFEVDFLSECNLRCRMCHQAKYIMPHDKLSQKNLNAIIDQLPMVETVMIAGLGEPLLYKKIDHFLPFLARYGCYSHMFTNGMLIHKKLAVLKHLKKVSISFDGATQSTFEYLRGRADFNQIVANIKKMHAYAPKILLATSTVVSNKNVSEISGIVELAESLGIKEVHLSPVDHTPDLALRIQDYETFKQQITAVKHSKIKVFNNINRSHFDRTNTVVSSSDKNLELQNFFQAELNHEIIELNVQLPKILLHQLPLKEEIKELRQRAKKMNGLSKQLENQIFSGQLKPKIPSCTALWKYGFFRSNNQVRLCPYADINVGNIETMLNNSFNSELTQKGKQQFRDHQPVLNVCNGCNDDHRKFKATELKQLQSQLLR